MKRLFLFFAALLLTLTTWAVPARRSTFTVQQPDGSVITLQLVGDEYFHYYRNVATGEALTLASDGSYVPLSSAEKQTRQKVGQQRRVAANAQRAKRMAKRRADGPNRVGGIKPTNGTKKGLVILVNFSDVKMKLSNPQTAFYNQFNQEGYSLNGHIGSVRDYFHDQSYGYLTIDFDVVGPVTVSRNMDYYGSNDSDGNDNYPATMIGEAVNLADAAGVDFSKYDWDGDKVVDQVYVIYAGYGEAAGGAANTIWPHEFTLSASAEWDDGPGALKLDGVTIDTYACSAELAGGSGSKISGIGTACHEFSHCLGFPDFYDTDYKGAFGMDAYDIMAGGSYNGPTGSGEVPSGYTAYERMAAGWLTPTELSGGKTVKGMKDLGTEGEAYVVYNPSKKDEYILFENRKADRWFKYLDNNTAGNGLLAIHVDFDETAWTENTPNNVANHQRMHVIPANKKDEASASAFFPAGAQSLTGTSHSTCGGKWFNGTNKTFDHAITEIKVTNGLVEFLFDGGGVEDDGSRYTVTFDPCGGSCATANLKEASSGAGVTLPAATVSVAGWTFAGWATERISENMSTSPKVYAANSNFKLTANTTLYAVYVYTETTSGTGSGNYECVEQEPSDWAGDYVIVPLENTDDDYYNLYVANGAQGGTSGIGAASAYIYPRSAGYDNNSDTFSASKADPYHVTIEKVNGQYYFKTGDGKYNYRSSTASSAGISTAEKASEAMPVSFVFNDWDDIRIRTAGGRFTFGFNLDSGKTYFLFYKNSTVSDYVKAGRSISLYRKQGSVLSSTYCSYPSGDAPTTVGALVKVINGLSSGTTTLNDLQNIINSILQR